MIPATKKNKTVKLTNNFLKYWAPFYFYAGVIFLLSSIPRPLPRIVIPHFDKLLHIFEYTLFGFLGSRAFKNSSKKIFFENFKIIAILLSIVYGISDEFHQRLVSERQFSIFDMVADSIGGVIGTFVYSKYC